MIPNRDLLSFNQGLLDLYAPGLDLESYPERGFRFLTRLVSVELTIYGSHNFDAAAPKLVFRCDRLLPEIELAIVPFALLMPKYGWFCAGHGFNEGKPYYRSDFCSDREYRDLDIHSEVFRRYGHENFMTMEVDGGGKQSVYFGFSRGKRDFSWKDRALLEMAAPHLRAALRMAAALGAARPWALRPDLFAGSGFTARESEILYWLTEGKSNVEISLILGMALPTVKGHLTAIFNKTGTGNRLAATLYAVDLAKRIHAEQAVRPSGPLSFAAPLGRPPTKVG